MSTFSPEIVAAVLHHMNDDHNDDSLLIMRAFIEPSAVKATMTSLDGVSGHWDYWIADDKTAIAATVAWPSGEISERAEIRREVVKLYELACDRLGLPQREH
ncbi:MAG: DUF2470 domain-containing protein [Microbacteriaceae bacterium]